MARVNLEYLKSFLAVVRLGGVRKAAQMLNLTQPAVTVRIKSCLLYTSPSPRD